MSVFSTQAIIDTSFWSICCHTGISSDFPLVWPEPIKMPGVVLGETFASRSPHAPRGLFMDQIQFVAAFTRGHIIAVNAYDTRTTPPSHRLRWRRAGRY